MSARCTLVSMPIEIKIMGINDIGCLNAGIPPKRLQMCRYIRFTPNKDFCAKNPSFNSQVIVTKFVIIKLSHGSVVRREYC